MMKKLLLSFYLFMFLFSVSWAVTVQVGSGTLTNSTLPISSCWGYTYSQEIYTQAQINSTGAITHLRFYYSSGPTTNSTAWVIYLGHTSKTSFASNTDWVPVTELTEVFNGTVVYPAAGNWMEIALTTPFDYNNLSNLVVAVDENTPGYNCSINWRSFTSGASTGIYYRSDATNPSPAAPPSAIGTTAALAQIQFEISPPAGAPGIPVNPGPANGASDIALSGDLTWDFGADTETYDLWFGPAGNMTQVVTGAAAGSSGSYAYTAEEYKGYQWQIIAKNGSKATTNGPVWSFTTICNTCCEHSVALVDSYGDGWNGGKLDVFVNGGLVLDDITLATGAGPATFYFDANNGSDIDVVYTAGSYGYENEYTVYDGGGTVLGQSGQGGSTPVSLSNLVGNCPSCPMPAGLSYSNITSNSADISWTSTAGSFNVKYNAGADFDPATEGTAVTPDPTTTTTALSSLSANTDYYWYVRAVCGVGDESEWAGPEMFTTFCEPFSANFSEYFDAVTAPAIPDCWFSIKNATASSAAAGTTTSGTPFSAANHFQLYNSFDNSAELLLVTPMLSDLTSQLNRIKFYAKGTSVGMTLLVGTMSDPTDGATFTLFETINLSTTYAEYIVKFDGSYTGTDQFIAFKHPNGGTYRTIYIDNFVYEASPTAVLSWYNLQWPGTATIEQVENVTVYAQCWESGVTEAAGPGAGIECWIGYNTENTDPGTWTNWVPATYNYGVDPNNNDEYMALLGAAQGLTEGTYYFASRFQYLEGPFTYGGFQGGPWGGGNVSGVLTINPCPASITAFPWSESFENVVAPACWNEVIVNDPGTDPNWTKEASTIHPTGGNPVDGSFLARFNSFTCPDFASARLETPFIDLSTLADPSIAFWMYRNSGYNTALNEGIYLQVSSDGVTWNNIGSLYQRYSPTIGWQRYTVDLSAFAGQTVMFGFLGISDFGDDVYIDHITIPAATEWTGAAKSNDWNVAGNWTNGIPTSNTDVTIPAGLGNYPTLTSTGACHDLFIGANNSGYATLMDDGYLMVTGTVSVQSYISTDVWHFAGTPVNGATADVFHLPGSTGLDVYLWGFTESTNSYYEIINTSTVLNNLTGYAVWADGANATPPVPGYTFVYEGGLNSGTFGAANNMTRTITGNDGGNNLMANPYPSGLDWDAVSGWTKTNLMDAFYIEDAGNWATYVGGVGIGTGNVIAPAQGFFVFVSDGTAPATGTLIMDNSTRVHTSTAFLKKSVSEMVRLEVSGNGKSDETVVRFLSDASLLFDEKYDAFKLIAFDETIPQIYSIANKKLAINATPQVDFVQLGFHAGVAGEYTISAIEINDIAEVWLEDTKTGVITNLNQSNYSFSYSTDDNAERFILHFTPLSVGEKSFDNVNIYSAGRNVFVKVPAATTGTIRIYNMMGQEMASKQIDDVVNKLSLAQSANYIVVVIFDDFTMTEKVFVK